MKDKLKPLVRFININIKVPDDIAYKIKLIACQKKMRQKELVNKILEEYAKNNCPDISAILDT